MPQQVCRPPRESNHCAQEIAPMGVSMLFQGQSRSPWKNKVVICVSQLLGYDSHSIAISFLPFISLQHERPKEGGKSLDLHRKPQLCNTVTQVTSQVTQKASFAIASIGKCLAIARLPLG